MAPDTQKQNTTTTTPAAKTPAKPVIVTSTKTIDFPSLNWGIHEGEERELPVDVQAQQTILASEYITIKK